MLLRVLSGARLKLSKDLYSYVGKDVDVYVFIGAPKIPLYHVTKIFKNFFIVTSKHDDIYVTKTARNLGVLLDAHSISLGDYSVAGIGGIDPWHAILRLRRLLSNQLGRRILLFSYFPAYGLCDFMPELGIRSGLLELKEFLDYIRPYVFVSSGNVECRIHYGESKIYTVSKDASFIDLLLSVEA